MSVRYREDEKINQIFSEYSKLAQKEYKTIHNWVRKVIYRELRKRCNKWYTD